MYVEEPVVKVLPFTVVGVIAPRVTVRAPSVLDADTPFAVVTLFTKVPVVAGNVWTVAVPATAEACIVTSPEVLPNIFTLPSVVAFTQRFICETPSVVTHATTFVSVVQAQSTTELAVSDHPDAVTVPHHVGVAKVPSHLRKVVVLFGGVGTHPPTVAVIVATLPVAIGVLKVCTPVNVLAASVLAIVALVEGNVIVVASVPTRVRELDTFNFLPLATTSHIY